MNRPTPYAGAIQNENGKWHAIVTFGDLGLKSKKTFDILGEAKAFAESWFAMTPEDYKKARKDESEKSKLD